MFRSSLLVLQRFPVPATVRNEALRAGVLCVLEVGPILVAGICQILGKKKENRHPMVRPSLPHFLKENLFLSRFDNSHLKNASCI